MSMWLMGYSCDENGRNGQWRVLAEISPEDAARVCPWGVMDQSGSSDMAMVQTDPIDGMSVLIASSRGGLSLGGYGSIVGNSQMRSCLRDFLALSDIRITLAGQEVTGE